MKTLASLLLVVSSWMHSNMYAQQRIPVFELHASGNHPLGNTRTFFGGGFGVNAVFMDDRKLSLKTGFEVNFFHTWNQSEYMGHMSSASNVHYQFWNLSIPLMIRLNVGERARFFLEAGMYLGIPIAGTSTFKYTSYGTSPQNPGYSKIVTRDFGGYFSISPAVGLGGIFPLTQRLDLIVKPELLLQKNFGVYDGPVADFNERFRYVRFCLGIRINLND